MTSIGKRHKGFFMYLITVLSRKYQDRSNQDPIVIFSYGLEERLQCVVGLAVQATQKGKNEDGQTFYEDVLLTQCIDSLIAFEVSEYVGPLCQRQVLAIKPVQVTSFPDILVLLAKKF